VLSIDGVDVYRAAQAPYQYSLDTDLLTNGVHLITLELVDLNGKRCAWDASFTVSNPPPAVTIEADAGAFHGSVQIAATIVGGSSPVRAWAEVDEAYLTTLSAQGRFTIDTRQLSDGAHRLNVTAEDAYGRRGQAEIAIVVANSGPTVSILTPMAQSEIAADAAVTLQITSHWPTAPVQIWLDGKLLGVMSSEPWTLPLDAASISNGVHRLNVTATDAHGGQGQAEVTFTVAHTGPVVSILTPTAEGEIITNSTVTLQITSQWPTAKVQAWVDGDLLGTISAEPWAFPLDISTLTEGTHQLKVSATDSHGEVGNATISFASRRVLPQLELGKPSGGSGSVEVSLNANVPLSYVVYYLDGVELANGSSAPFTCTIDTGAYADGLHVLNATAVLNDGTKMQMSKDLRFLNSAKASGVGFVLDFKDLDLIFLQALIIVLVLAVVLGKTRRKR
jgi:glutaredoxin-related protein